MQLTTALSAGLRSLAIQCSNPVTTAARLKIAVQGLKSASLLSQRSLHITGVARAEEPTAVASAEAGEALPATTRKTRTVRKTSTTATKKKSATSTAAKTVKKRKAAAKPKAPPKPKRVLNPPKRITSAWLLYYQDELSKLPKEERKDVTVLSKSIVEKFRALSDAERQQWEQKLSEHRAQWEKDMQDYMSKVTPQMIEAENEYRRAQRKASKKKQNPRLVRDPTKPTAPLNGYMRWLNETRNDPERSRQVFGVSDPKTMGIVEAAKAAATAWKAMSDADKGPYNQAYSTDKEQYTRELDAWKAKSESAKSA